MGLNPVPVLHSYIPSLTHIPPWRNISHVVNTSDHGTLIAAFALWPLILPGTSVTEILQQIQ